MVMVVEDFQRVTGDKENDTLRHSLRVEAELSAGALIELAEEFEKKAEELRQIAITVHYGRGPDLEGVLQRTEALQNYLRRHIQSRLVDEARKAMKE